MLCHSTISALDKAFIKASAQYSTEPLWDKSPRTQEECASYIYKRFLHSSLPTNPITLATVRYIGCEPALPTFLTAIGRPAGNTGTVPIPFFRLLLPPLELQRHRRIFRVVPGRHGDETGERLMENVNKMNRSHHRHLGSARLPTSKLLSIIDSTHLQHNNLQHRISARHSSPL